MFPSPLEETGVSNESTLEPLVIYHDGFRPLSR